MGETRTKLKIVRVCRIDYPRLEDRIETEPLGLYFGLEQKNSADIGLRVCIDNSGSLISFSVEDEDELLDYVSGIYATITTVDSSSPLNKLLQRSITAVFLGHEQGNEFSSEQFVSGFGPLVAFRLDFESAPAFVFWNDGDEGEYSFGLEELQSRSIFEGLVWRRQDYLMNSLLRKTGA